MAAIDQLRKIPRIINELKDLQFILNNNSVYYRQNPCPEYTAILKYNLLHTHAMVEKFIQQEPEWQSHLELSLNINYINRQMRDLTLLAFPVTITATGPDGKEQQFTRPGLWFYGQHPATGWSFKLQGKQIIFTPPAS